MSLEMGSSFIFSSRSSALVPKQSISNFLCIFLSALSGLSVHVSTFLQKELLIVYIIHTLLTK